MSDEPALAADSEPAEAPPMEGCPPRPDTEKAVGFSRKPMVRWLSPWGLVNTGAEVALSGIFGRYADKRELQAVLAASEVSDLSAEPELWIDYVADTGDGFDPTHSVAHLLAADRLTVAHGDEAFDTEHARLLVFGGDEVYPTASEEAYNDRLIGPLRAALPCTPEGAPRSAFLIPGNHDWYDGLTSFLRLFCQGGWIGGWKTEQARSYFAVRLPHRWWLWGVDIQFDCYIDEPQLAFFEQVARTECEPGDNVILCTAKPSWVREGLSGDEIYADEGVRRNLEFFERRIMVPRGLAATIMLAGDLHHYARYEAVTDTPGGTRRQKVTSGGGGAFLYPTHNLPPDVRWPRHAPDGTLDAQRYEQRAVYPDVDTSLRLRWNTVWAPFTNLSFVALLGVIYVLLAWTTAFALGSAPLAETVPGATLPALAVALVRGPASLLLAVLVLLGTIGFARVPGTVARVAVGVVHGGLHLLVMLLLMRLGGLVLDGAGGWAFALGLVVLVGLLGALAGGVLMGLYLLIAHVVLGVHANEAFSAQHIPHHKSFLRLHIGADGEVTIYPIAIDRVATSWTFQPDGPRDAPWFTPDTALQPHLIEAPVRVRPEPAPDA